MDTKHGNKEKPRNRGGNSGRYTTEIYEGDEMNNNDWEPIYPRQYYDKSHHSGIWEYCVSAFLVAIIFGSLAMIEVEPVSYTAMPASEVAR